MSKLVAGAIRTRTVVEQIADQMRDDILSRRLAPGERLREVALAERFGVSRQAIREAIQLVRNHGLIEETSAYKGARVVFFSRDELNDLYEFRGFLFAYTVRQACARATAEQMTAFGEKVAELCRAAGRPGDGREYETLRVQAHDLLGRATGSLYEVNRRRQIIMRTNHQYGADVVATPSKRRASAQRWQRLFELVSARNGAAAEAFALEMNEAMREATLQVYDKIHKAHAKK